MASQGGKYTKHIYIGSQRIVSKLGDLASYGADPRRILYAGYEADGITIDYKTKYVKQQQQPIKDSYKDFGVAYNGEDNDNYVNGEGFCCNDKSLEAAQERAKAARNAKTRAVDKIAYLLHALTTGIETDALIRKALGKNGLTLLDSR